MPGSSSKNGQKVHKIVKEINYCKFFQYLGPSEELFFHTRSKFHSEKRAVDLVLLSRNF